MHLQLRSSNDVSVAVHPFGPDRGGAHVLLAHATGFHARVWQPIAQRLNGRFAWAPDLRGHGDTEAPTDHQFRWESFADDVLATVDGIEMERPLGVGHSKGGAALLLAEARRPGTFRALWLYEPVVFPPDFLVGGGSDSNPLAAGARLRRETFDSYEAAEENFRSKPPMNGFDPDVLRAYVRHGFSEQADGSVRLKCSPSDEAQVYEMGARHQAWERLDRVTCPVTLVRGRLDGPGPAGFAAPVVERLPAGRLEAHDDLGHFGPMEAPGRMARSILAADPEV